MPPNDAIIRKKLVLEERIPSDTECEICLKPMPAGTPAIILKTDIPMLVTTYHVRAAMHIECAKPVKDRIELLYFEAKSKGLK